MNSLRWLSAALAVALAATPAMGVGGYVVGVGTGTYSFAGAPSSYPGCTPVEATVLLEVALAVNGSGQVHWTGKDPCFFNGFVSGLACTGSDPGTVTCQRSFSCPFTANIQEYLVLSPSGRLDYFSYAETCNPPVVWGNLTLSGVLLRE